MTSQLLVLTIPTTADDRIQRFMRNAALWL